MLHAEKWAGKKAMTTLLLRNARVFDGVNAECAEGMNVLVEGGLIREVSSQPVKMQDGDVIDVGGRTLMPGLIDAHIHAYGSDLNVQKIELAGDAYRTAYAARMLGHALDCGFTTVRDVGGGDWSLWRAIEDGLIRAPRFLYAGKFISMTGGHGDFRQAGESGHDHALCACGAGNAMSHIADGVDAVVRAAREELRRGAHCVKIMCSGGVLSPTDPIWMNQYREDEIRAIVNETDERHTYAAAHCHPASAIRRAVECGVRSIEHGTLIDDDTARFVAERGGFIVPTMVICFVLVELGQQAGVSPDILAKARSVYGQALSGMESMRRAGVKVGFGTDLLGAAHQYQCREFTIRREVFTPLEILRQATSVNAELLQQKDRLGCIKPGACADLLVVDGDPLEDIGLLAADGKKLLLLMRDGKVLRNGLS
jgi:imidazolonepropionase-like amidohydrolase